MNAARKYVAKHSPDRCISPRYTFYTLISRPSKEILIFIKAVQLNFREDIS